MLQIGLVVMFLVATVALLVDGLTRARAWWVAAFLAVAAVAAGLTISSNGQVQLLGPLAVFVAVLLAVAAARDVPRRIMLVVGVAALTMSPVVLIVVFFGGTIAGQT